MNVSKADVHECPACRHLFRQAFQLAIHRAAYPNGECVELYTEMRPRTNRARRRKQQRAERTT